MSDVPRSTPRPISPGGHPHGRPISWIFVTVVIIVFTTGGLALILANWALFWTCFGLLLLAAPVGRAIRITDDTIAWTNPLPGEDENLRNKLR
ncbi:hypothetical protein Aph01nite_04960 [Acrocarpospora phusangensis]|uniref:Uncharacterized protein n=1 Tax=Acrocarpospora phusangensis TaxID=1070424 RepID=A0A919UI19_9ACTN|nr:HGxxPAAW family protein [Acrocarpospora phusangensis]GIH22186.1 hypothetical protein Aph01nite_04960 [Acrocarpospora phusangensis]